MKKYNFNAGPSVLPESVLAEAADAVKELSSEGLSILELGHRTAKFEAVINEASEIVKRLMGLDDSYSVLFLQGGGTTQFMQIPMNFLSKGKVGAYINNGIWGKKAIESAQYFGAVDVVSNTESQKHACIEKQFSVPENAAYLYATINNTVEGTEWFSVPNSQGKPLIADMSSDIFSRPFAYDQFDLIFAGAQKNMGCAGVTMVVVKKQFADSIQNELPPIMDYRKLIDSNSLLNTPPVISIYVALLVLRWIENEGGLKEMEHRAILRSSMLYNVLDSIPLYIPKVAISDRSRMNATFDIADESLKSEFLQKCDSNGFIGVKGHRSVGGLRVSMYNALPIEDLEVLVDFMKDFAEKKG